MLLQTDHQRLPPHDYHLWQHLGPQQLLSLWAAVKLSCNRNVTHICFGSNTEHISRIHWTIKLSPARTWKTDLWIFQNQSLVIILVHDCVRCSILFCHA